MGRPQEKATEKEIEASGLEEIVEASKANVSEQKNKKRGRGRPKGTTKKSQKTEVKEDPEIKIRRLEATKRAFLPLIHAPYLLAANHFDCGDLALEDKEAEMIATPVAELIELYAPSMDPKTAAWLGFASALGGITLQKIMVLKALQQQREQNSITLDGKTEDKK